MFTLVTGNRERFLCTLFPAQNDCPGAVVPDLFSCADNQFYKKKTLRLTYAGGK